MRILILSSYARDTGSWVRTANLARALSAHAEVELVPARSRCLPWRLDHLLSLPRYLLRALFSRADLMITGKPFPNTAIPLLLARLLRRIPIVVDIDDLDAGYLSGPAAWVLDLVQRPFPRHFDLVTYHHPALEEHIHRHFRVRQERLCSLPQGVMLDTFGPCSTPPEAGRLFFMGHLDVASCLGTILEALALVARERPVKVTVVGGGLLAGQFQRQAARLGLAVDFTGHLPVAAAARAMERAQVCLVYHDPTRANLFRCSMKIREYLARGKKVVANDYGDLAEFAPYTFQSPSGAESYAKAIAEALAVEDGREEAGREYVEQRYDWRRIAASFHKRLEGLVARRSGAHT